MALGQKNFSLMVQGKDANDMTMRPPGKGGRTQLSAHDLLLLIIEVDPFLLAPLLAHSASYYMLFRLATHLLFLRRMLLFSITRPFIGMNIQKLSKLADNLFFQTGDGHL